MTRATTAATDEDDRGGNGRIEIGRLEIAIDEKRQCLRPAGERAREHDRGAELAQRPRPTHDQTGSQRGRRQGHRDPAEDAAFSGAVDSGRVLELALDSSNAGSGGANEVRRSNKNLGQHDSRRRERQSQAQRGESVAEHAAPPEDKQQREAGDGRWQHDRQIDDRLNQGPAGHPASRESKREGQSKDQDEHDRDGGRDGAQPQRVDDCRRAERLQHRATGEAAQNEDQDRQPKYQQRWYAGDHQSPLRFACYGAAPNPCAARTACASAPRIHVRKSAAVLALVDALTATPP